MKVASGCSWDQLDAKLLPLLATVAVQRSAIGDSGEVGSAKIETAGGRRRVLHRIYRLGLSPEAVRGSARSNLVEAVRQTGLFSKADAFYTSPLWELAATPHDTFDDIDQVLAVLQHRTDYFQATRIEERVAHYAKLQHPAFHSAKLVAGWATVLAGRGTVDAIAMLSCCLQLAVWQCNYRMAADLLEALDHAVETTSQAIGEPSIQDALPQLVRHRIVRRDFSMPIAIEGTFRWLRTTISSDRNSVISEAQMEVERAWTRQHLDESQEGLRPLVPRDAMLEQFIREFPLLYASARRQWRDELSIVPYDQLSADGKVIADTFERLYFGRDPKIRP